jgi:hypothetical protein
MPKGWTKTEAFAHFGVELDNVRWSWSGVSPDEETVAVLLWQDGVRRDGDRIVYADDEDLNAEWRRRQGHAARVRHLAHCLARGGRFRAVIARAADVNADPREIASCFPQQGVWWQLDSFDEATGAFTAHALPPEG